MTKIPTEVTCCKKCRRSHDYGPQDIPEDAPAYFCGNSTCECHTAHQSSQSKGAEWEEEFENGGEMSWLADIEGTDQRPDVKAFIAKLLSERDEKLNSNYFFVSSMEHFKAEGFAAGVEAERVRMKEKIEGMMTSEFGDPDRPFYGTVAARSHAKVHNAILKKVLELFSPTHQTV